MFLLFLTVWMVSANSTQPYEYRELKTDLGLSNNTYLKKKNIIKKKWNNNNAAFVILYNVCIIEQAT